LRASLPVGTVVDVARRLRIQEVDGIHHCTQHGVEDISIFRDDRDRQRFLYYLADELVRSDWECLAYTLMGTHYHLLLRLRKETLSTGLQHLNARYAQVFNRIYERRGHLFEARFHDEIVDSEAYRYEATRYIHLNAPKAGLCERPEDWPWCDYGSTMGIHSPDPIVDPSKALDFLGRDLRSARRLYRRFVEERDPRVRRGLTRV
jgi:REP element-mobilizing transposase RayT